MRGRPPKKVQSDTVQTEMTDEAYARQTQKWAKVKILCDYFKANSHLRKYQVTQGKTVDLMDEIFLGGQTLKQVSEKLEG